MTKRFISIIALFIVFVITLVGCGPSLIFQIKDALGYYPRTDQFSNTKWVCRELDMTIYMFECGESNIIGTYKYAGETYRVVTRFFFEGFDIDIYDSTSFSDSEHSESMVECERESYGFINTDYEYDKKNGNIVCKVRNHKLRNSEKVPDTLTFEKVGKIAQNSDERWYAEGIDMYLDSFDDVDGYYSGKIIIDGKELFINAVEIGKGGYYEISIENGILNNSKKNTTEQFVRMRFEKENDRIVASISDELETDKLRYSDWRYGDSIVIFSKES